MATPIEIRSDKAGSRLTEIFNRHGFETCYCRTRKEPFDKALSYIKDSDVVSWGGCQSAMDIGLIDELRKGAAEGRYQVIDRDTAKTPDERMELMRKALLCDVYIGGANALSETGELVNIDGNGNRVAAMTFGPKSVIVVASLNKVMPDLDSAMKRARSVAAPVNIQRFGLSTPCSSNGLCADCSSPDRVCNYFQIIARSKPAGKIKLILVGENVGF